MTTINCSLKCKHQCDGKCTLEDAISQIMSAETDCVFFEERTNTGKSCFNCNDVNE